MISSTLHVRRTYASERLIEGGVFWESDGGVLGVEMGVGGRAHAHTAD